MKRLKYIIIFVIFLACAMADQKFSQLPVDATVHLTDRAVILDQGTTNKTMTFATLLDPIHDTANILRTQIGDTATLLRSIIGGGGAFSLTGHYIYPTTLSDSIGVNTSTPDFPLDVNGEARVNDVLYTPQVWFGTGPLNSSGVIRGYGDDLFISANNTSEISLLELIQSNFTLVGGTTMVPTVASRNWNFGGTAATTYKVNVTGKFNATDEISLPTNTRFYMGTSFMHEYVSGGTTYLFFTLANQGNAQALLQSTGTTSGIFNCDYFKSYQTAAPTVSQEGMFYYDATDHEMKVRNASAWVSMGGTLSSHMTDTLWLDYLDGDPNVWLTLTSTGGIDTAHTVNAWYGLEMDLENPVEYFNDKKMVNGHLELKVWYLDDDTHLPKFQYGYAGISPTETASAFMILHEITLRYIVQHENTIEKYKHDRLSTLIISVLMSVLICIIFMFINSKRK